MARVALILVVMGVVSPLSTYPVIPVREEVPLDSQAPATLSSDEDTKDIQDRLKREVYGDKNNTGDLQNDTTEYPTTSVEQTSNETSPHIQESTSMEHSSEKSQTADYSTEFTTSTQTTEETNFSSDSFPQEITEPTELLTSSEESEFKLPRESESSSELPPQIVSTKLPLTFPELSDEPQINSIRSSLETNTEFYPSSSNDFYKSSSDLISSSPELLNSDNSEASTAPASLDPSSKYSAEPVSPSADEPIGSSEQTTQSESVASDVSSVSQPIAEVQQSTEKVSFPTATSTDLSPPSVDGLTSEYYDSFAPSSALSTNEEITTESTPTFSPMSTETPLEPHATDSTNTATTTSTISSATNVTSEKPPNSKSKKETNIPATSASSACSFNLLFLTLFTAILSNFKPKRWL